MKYSEIRTVADLKKARRENRAAIARKEAAFTATVNSLKENAFLTFLTGLRSRLAARRGK